MGLVEQELTFNFRQPFIQKTITNFRNHVSPIANIDSFLKSLEEELKKIDAFKRELPLSMILLNDAIVALKEESVQCTARNVEEPVLEEFIPLKNSEEDVGSLITTKKEQDSNNNYKDKKNWMSSVQLWNTDDDDYCSTNHNLDTKIKDEDRCKNKGGSRAFMPLTANLGFPARKEENEVFSVHGLTLSTPGIKNTKEESDSTGSGTSCSRAVSCSVATNALSNFRSGPPSIVLSDHLQQQASKKQRRCWSPELHRRFINALHQLGGSHVATPKQIRDLMHVDGLTNDEVKSHLQKYRLHTRRHPAITTTTTTTTTLANKSAVVSGSGRAWMSGDQYGVHSKGSSSQSGSPQGPLQFTGGTSTTGGDSMEDDEDAKSECYSWKSHVYKPGKNNV